MHMANDQRTIPASESIGGAAGGVKYVYHGLGQIYFCRNRRTSPNKQEFSSSLLWITVSYTVVLIMPRKQQAMISKG